MLPVRVRLPEVVAKLRNDDPFVIGAALIDTGATGTCVSKKVAEALALKPVGTIKVGGVGGANEHFVFHVRFEFIKEMQPANTDGSVASVQRVIGISDCEVIEADIDEQGLAMLIGRDVLSQSAFTYDGPTGTWTLEIPRTQPPGQVKVTSTPPIDPIAAGAKPQHSTLRSRYETRAARKAARKARKKNRGSR